MSDRFIHFIRSIFFMYNWDYSVLLVFLLAVSIIYIAFKELTTNERIKRIIIFSSLLIYVGLMIYTTLIDRESSSGERVYCLIPFNSYYRFFNGDTDIMQQSIMNVAFFYPFGFLLSCFDSEILKKRKWIIVLLAFLFSACVEVCQYKFALGYAEVDDVIHNTLGAAIGVFAYNSLDKLVVRFFKRKK